LKKITTALLAIALLATITSSLAYAAAGDIWLAGYLLLTLKTPTEAKAFQARVDAVQLRANDLLALEANLPKIEVRSASIYAGGKVFLIITPADAKVAGKTVDQLAKYWAQQLRTILPKATPIKH
jgi:hypothetical protein